MVRPVVGTLIAPAVEIGFGAPVTGVHATDGPRVKLDSKTNPDAEAFQVMFNTPAPAVAVRIGPPVTV